MPRRGENIYKRKDGRWEGRYIRDYDLSGKARYGYLYAKTYMEVKSKLHSVISKKNKYEDMITEIRFSEMLDQWLLNIKPQIKDSSYIKYYNIIKNHIRPDLGDLIVTEITNSKLEDYVRYLFEYGKKNGHGNMAPKSVKDILAVVKLVQEFGIRRNCHLPCQVQNIRIKSEVKDITILNLPDQKRLERYLLSRDNRVCDGILLSLYSGIRIGELCALRWENILCEDGIIQIRCTMQRIQSLDDSETDGPRTKILISTPKSKCSNREIPLPDFLKKRIKDISGPAPSCFFLTGSEQYVEPRCMSNQLKNILKILNIPDVNFHVLRHTFATRCIENNFDIKALSEILGHSSVNITLNRYVHTSLEQKRRNMKKLNL